MKLSIVVPFYNAENHLDRCIYSLVNQGINYNDYEIILINDGSTDNSKKVSETLSNSYSNIVLHNQKNIGLGATRNVGIDLAKGEYIYFIDADDYLVFNLLGELLKHLDKFDLDLIAFKSISTSNLDLFESETKKSIKNLEVISGREFVSNSNDFVLMAWWYISKRDLLVSEKLKFPESRFLEDGPFTFRLFLEVEKMLYVPIVGHRYVKVANSIMNNDNQSHLKKLLDDYVFLIHNFNDLKTSLLHKDKFKYLDFLKKIQFWSDVNVYMLFYKFIKSKDLSISGINYILKDLKNINAYPLKYFVGTVNNSMKHKIITFLFNNKNLFYFFLYPLRALYRLKILKLP